MSLEQYLQLAKQEQHEIPKSFIPKVIYNVKLITSFLLFSTHTKLETSLIQDQETFTSNLTETYSFTDTYEKYGEIFTLKIPHPLRTQLNNSAISKDIGSKLEAQINATPVLVFIHGLGGNLQQFDEVTAHFDGITDLFAVDLPGSGKSIQNPGLPLTLDVFTEFVKDALEKNGYLGRNIIFVGHSYGTQVVLKLTNLIPNVKGLILLAPPRVPLTRSWKETFFLNLFLRVPGLFPFFRKLDRLNNIQSLSMKRLFANPEATDFHKLKQFRFNLLTNSKNFLTHALSWEPLTISEVIDSSQTIASNEGKILIVDGAQDKLTRGGGASIHDLLGSQISRYEILENSGHNFFLDSPKTLNPLLDGFIQSLDPKLTPKFVDTLRGKLSEVQ